MPIPNAKTLAQNLNASQTEELLEALINAQTLETVLERLTDICNLKAAHIEETWQDMSLADRWATMAHGLDTTRATARKLTL